ncbi:MAG TPA: DUF58 domain-containing protein [Anaerolineales bacterium]|nr:DUF58 domain-containing protein [Anaerolineales bacterium]
MTDPAPRITLKSRLFPLLVAVCLVLYLLDPYRGWLTLFIGMGLALASGYVWVRSLQRGLRFVHERRYSWTQVGDAIEERFILRNAGWLPAIWVDVDYQTTMPGYRSNRAAGAPARSEFGWTTRGFCERRGLFELGPLTLRTGDPLGIFELTFSYPSSTTVLVSPPVIPLPAIEIPPGGRSGDSRTRRPSFETSVNVSDVRPYIPGDSIRLIHWPTTARTGAYYVRVMESTPASDWWIFLDLDERSLAGSDEVTTEEHGVILAASLLDKGLRTGQAVGLVTQTGALAWHPPRFGETHRQEMMRALALAASGPLSLGDLLRQARPHFRKGPSLIVITADMRPDWIADLAPLAHRRVAPYLFLLDPGSYPGPGPAASSDRLVKELAGLGLDHTVLEAGFFDRQELRPGRQGRWVWRKTRSSRVVAESRPADQPWKRV